MQLVQAITDASREVRSVAFQRLRDKHLLALFTRQRLELDLEREAARPAWLEFSFDDIRYLIVPTIQARIELIKEILALPPEGFSTSESENIGKSVLISKILVLDEIRKDW